MRIKITKRAVDAARPGPRDQFLWDTELRGFGVKVTPAGAKLYVLGYHLANGRRRRYTLHGAHGAPWTVETARKEARALLGKIAQRPIEGEQQYDPVAARTLSRTAETVEELAGLFVKHHVVAKLRPTTRHDYQRIINTHIVPALGKLKVNEVAAVDVMRLHRSRRHAPRQADQMLAVISSMFSFAERERLRQRGTNPARDVDRFGAGQERDPRFLSAVELDRLGAVLAQASRDGQLEVPARDKRPEQVVPIDPRAIAAIRLLIFTGARLGEILGLRWDYVDLERGIARLPESKTGKKTIFLPAPARAVLAALGRQEGSPFVLPGVGAAGHLSNPYPAWYAVRELAGLPDVRIHDLRHSFASSAVAGGVSLYAVQALLGHTDAKTTQRYAHLAPDPVAAAAELVGQRIADALGGAAPPENVVALTSRRKSKRGQPS